MEDYEAVYNKHYITLDEQSRVIGGFSDAFHEPSDGDICINKQGGYQFRIILNGEPTEENPPLFDGVYMIPLYKWTGSEVVRRTTAELEADRQAAREAAESAEQERIANDPATLSMEMAVDHELRISMLEIGLTERGEI